MIVVADTSPLNYLVIIGQIHLLSCLYTTVMIPSAVADELRQPDAPKKVRTWISNPPKLVDHPGTRFCIRSLFNRFGPRGT